MCRRRRRIVRGIGAAATVPSSALRERCASFLSASCGLISEASHQSAGLGLFIRSLVGLDREAAAQLFSEFVGGTNATPEQIEFIDLIINELTQNGVMEPERLFQSPYTDLNAQGPMGLFPQAEVMQIVGVLKLVKERAAA